MSDVEFEHVDYEPYPEALAEGEWEVTPGFVPSFSSSQGVHRMVVPVGSSQADRYDRVHQMAGVKYRTGRRVKAPEGVSDMMLDAAEEARVDTMAAWAGSLPDLDGIVQAHGPIHAGLKHLLLAKKFDRLVASLGALSRVPVNLDLNDIYVQTGDENDKTLAEMAQNITQLAASALAGSKYKSYKKGSIPLACALQKMVEVLEEDEALEEKTKSSGDDDPDGEEVDEALEYSKRRSADASMFKTAGYSAEWGQMAQYRYPLTRMLPTSKLKSPVSIASDTGVVPNRVHRLTTDGMVFSRRVRRAGGTILVDMSGSMHLSNEHVMDMVEAVPAGTIAAYSGSFPWCRRYEFDDIELPEVLKEDRNIGSLRILGEKGRYVADDVDLSKHPDGLYWGGNNFVDGPALEWLAKQKGPRIWVSDGAVTGDQGSDVLLHDHVLRVCRSAKILRVDTAEDAIRYFGRSR